MTIAAVSLMCQDANVWVAMFNSGTPCPLTVNGRLIVGRAAYYTMKKDPLLFIPDYKDRETYYKLSLQMEKQNEEDTDSSLTISEQFRQVYADQAINNLVDISGLIAGKVQNARHAVAGAHHLAAQGTTVGVDTVTPHNITMEEMAAYNDALQGVRDAVYYNTQMFFEDKHEEAMDNLGDAVDMFTVAAQQLVVVEAVSEVAQRQTP